MPPGRLVLNIAPITTIRTAHLDKNLMITGLNPPGKILTAFRSQCVGYLVKPIDRARLTAQLANLGFTPS
jgi:AmiR/NasT family two-component response regulator